LPNSDTLLETLISRGHGDDAREDLTREVRATQYLVAGGSLLYFLWHFLAVKLDPSAYDPLWMRASMAGLCLLVGALLFKPVLVPWRDKILMGLFALATMHVTYLMAINHFSQFYFVSVLACVACCGVVLTNMRSFFLYSAIIGVWVFVVAFFDTWASWREYLQLAAALATLQTVTALGLWRRLKAEAMARGNLKQARDFLRKVIDAVPDPVFVKDAQDGWLMVNEAFRRYSQSESAELTRSSSELQAVTFEDPVKKKRVSAGPEGQWVEEDVDLVLEGVLQKSVASKVATAALVSGRVFEVGVIRDVTERKRLEAALEEKVRELQSAQKQVRRLEGLLPICMHCGRIREGQDHWQELEVFIEKNSDASFSHVLCRSCLDEHHPGLEDS
jgi:PAS domain S-box-containing protein